MKVTVTVNKCYDCPHFYNHPYEASCNLRKGFHVISHRVAEKTIDKDCPLKNK